MEWNLLLANFLTVVAGVVLANFLRSLYAEFLERMKLKNQLRLAVLDQRPTVRGEPKMRPERI